MSIDASCFPGLPLIEQRRAILSALGSDACIFTEQDFWRAWLILLDPEACAEPSVEALQGAVYGLLYAQAGDDSLVSPACFYGLSPDQRELAIFEGSLNLLPAPDNLTVEVTDDTVVADWDAVFGAGGYEYNIGNGWVDVGAATDVTLTGVADGSYVFRVRAYDTHKGRTSSQSFTVSTGGGEDDLFFGPGGDLFFVGAAGGPFFN